MKARFAYALFALFIVASMILAGCSSAPAAQPNTGAGDSAGGAVEVKDNYVAMSLAADSCDYGGEFKSIETVDKYTVKFTLCYSDPAFASKAAFSVFSIADKESLDAAGGDSIKMSDAINGTGPYTVKEWAHGDRIIFESNPNYWGEAPAIKTVIFRWSDQAAQRLLELQSGTADGIDNPAPEDFDTIKTDSNLALFDRPPLNVFFVGFNNTIAPFDNQLVREAIAYGIDRQRIVDQYYPAGSLVAKTFVPPLLVPGYNPNAEWYPYDVEKAKELLTEAGYPDGLEVDLSYRNVVRGYLPSPDKVAQEIQAQLALVGITVNINQMESTTFIDSTAAGKEGFYLLGWGADYPDATNFYDYHFAGSGQEMFGTQYPDLVEALKSAGQIADATKRQEYYDKANELLKEYVVMIPVAHGASATAYKANVQGAHASPLSNEQFSVMSNGSDQFVWMQNGEPAALWCSDETDGESLRACEQVYEPLLGYEIGGTKVVSGLAESWETNTDATEWTFKLREGVSFANGAGLDASDVVATYVSQWDASSPNHTGRTGSFEYFGAFFGAMLNTPAE